MLEAGFLGIMMFGWQRVPRAMHLVATSMVALGGSISAFWILVANSWMQTPAGGHMVNGHFVDRQLSQAVFNPDMPWGVSHMWVACLETSLFVVGGASAWHLFRGRDIAFFRRSLSARRGARRDRDAAADLSRRQQRQESSSRSSRPRARRSKGHWSTNPARPARRLGTTRLARQGGAA